MNSKEMENRGSGEEYSFLQETIRPQRKRQVLRYVGKVMATTALAVVFGVVGAVGFHVTQGVLEERDKLTERGEAASVDTAVTTADETDMGSDSDAEMNSDLVTAYESYWKGVAAIGKRSNKSAVSVRVNHRQSWYKRNGSEDVSQSGVLFRKTGQSLFVLTQDSSVSQAKSLKVGFVDGTEVEAETIGRDESLGIAVVKIKSEQVSRATIKAVNIQDLKKSAKGLQLDSNQGVVCFGAPDGIMRSVIPGSIINTGLSAEVQDGQMQLCCIDVNYSEDGNGFVSDLSGNMIGMLTTSYTDITGNINSAFVPVSDIADTALLLSTGKEVPVLGVMGCDIQKGYLGLDEGVYIKKIVVNSPAYEAGLRVTDVIKEIGGYEISDLADLRTCLLNHSEGEKLKVKILRNSGDNTSDKELTVTLK